MPSVWKRSQIGDAMQVIEGPFRRLSSDGYNGRNVHNSACGWVHWSVLLSEPSPSLRLQYPLDLRTGHKTPRLSFRLLCHSTVPFTSTISFKFSPIFTTPHLTILGSIAIVFRTSCCTAGEASKRMMKWCPLS